MSSHTSPTRGSDHLQRRSRSRPRAPAARNTPLEAASARRTRRRRRKATSSRSPPKRAAPRVRRGSPTTTRGVRRAAAHPLPAGDRGGDRQHAPAAGAHRSGAGGVRERRSAQELRERVLRLGAGRGRRLGGDPGRQPRQQDQPARIRSRGLGHAGDQPRHNQDRAPCVPQAETERRSSGSWWGSCSRPSQSS